MRVMTIPLWCTVFRFGEIVVAYFENGKSSCRLDDAARP